jgi:acyl carrier protein
MEPGKEVQLISYLDETHKLLNKAQENLLLVARAIQPVRPEDCETANPDVIKNYIPENLKLEISQQLIVLIHEKLGTISEIAPTTNLHTDIDMDSLDAVELTMAIEDFFNITVEDEEAENITTLQSAIDFIFKKLEAKKTCDYGSPETGTCSLKHSSDSRQEEHCFHSKLLSNKCESYNDCAFTSKSKELKPITIDALLDLLKECRHCAEYGYKNAELVDQIDEIIAKS